MERQQKHEWFLYMVFFALIPVIAWVWAQSTQIVATTVALQDVVKTISEIKDGDREEHRELIDAIQHLSDRIDKITTTNLESPRSHGTYSGATQPKTDDSLTPVPNADKKKTP